ncbi:hypothetical protein QOT17_016922 [Balamuthia mandrillaris]
MTSPTALSLLFFLLFACVWSSEGESHTSFFLSSACQGSGGSQLGTSEDPFCDLQAALDHVQTLPPNSTVHLFLRGQFLVPNDNPSFRITNNTAAQLVFQTDPQEAQLASFSSSSPDTNATTLFVVEGENTLSGCVILFRGILFQRYQGQLLKVYGLGSSSVEIALEKTTVQECDGVDWQSGFEVLEGADSVFRAERCTFFNNSFYQLIIATNVEVTDCQFHHNSYTPSPGLDTNYHISISGRTNVMVQRSSFLAGGSAIRTTDSERVVFLQLTFQHMSRTGVFVSMQREELGVSFEMEDCLFEDSPAPALEYIRGLHKSTEKRQLERSQARVTSSTFRRITSDGLAAAVYIHEFNDPLLNVDTTDYFFSDLLFEENDVVVDNNYDVDSSNCLTFILNDSAGPTSIAMQRLYFYRNGMLSSISVGQNRFPVSDMPQLTLDLRDSVVQDSGSIYLNKVAFSFANVLVERSKGMIATAGNNSFISDSYFLFNEGAGIQFEANGLTLHVDKSHISWNEGGGIIASQTAFVVVSRSNLWGNRFGGGLHCHQEARIIANDSVSLHRNNYVLASQSFNEVTCSETCSITIPFAEDGCAAAASCPQGFDVCSSCQGTGQCIDCTGIPFGNNNCSSPLRFRLSEDNETTVVLQFNSSQPHAMLLPINDTTGAVEEGTYSEWRWQTLVSEEEEFLLDDGEYLRCGPVVTVGNNGKVRSLKMIHRKQLANNASVVLEQYLLGEDSSFWLAEKETNVISNSLKSNVRIYDWPVPQASSLTLNSQLRFSHPIFSIQEGRHPDLNSNNKNVSSFTIQTNITATPLSISLLFLAEQQEGYDNNKFLSNNFELSQERPEERDDELQLSFLFNGPYDSLLYDPDFTVLFSSPQMEDGEDGIDEEDEEKEDGDDLILVAIVVPCVVGGVIIVAVVIGGVGAMFVLQKKNLQRAKTRAVLARAAAKAGE